MYFLGYQISNSKKKIYGHFFMSEKNGEKNPNEIFVTFKKNNLLCH